MTNVFVYGTLRKGFGNNRLLINAKFLGKATTNNKYSMFGSGIPYVNKNIAKYPIEGEVYQVTKAELQDLDRLEGHPEWYCRELIPVTITVNEEDKTIEAYIYFNDYKDNPFPTGDYVENLKIRSGKKQAPVT